MGPFDSFAFGELTQGHSTRLEIRRMVYHERAVREANCESNGGRQGIRTPDLLGVSESL